MMAGFDVNLWLRQLSEYRTTSISQSFENLLTTSINIPEGIRSIASASHQNLRKFLQTESERDCSFPGVLQSEDSDFLGGSFARHTKIRPLDDIDIYLPLNGGGLGYFVHGVQQPYRVLSDSEMQSPLLGGRWADGQWVSSSKLVDGFAEVLRRRFPQTDVSPSGEAVRVDMTMGASTRSDGLGYDVVPCFSLAPLHGNGQSFYLIPDGGGGWIRTNPKVDAGVAAVLQENHKGNFRKIAKLVKYWNAEQLGGRLESYFIELAIARHFWDEAVHSRVADPLSYGVALAFWAVQNAVTKGFLESRISGAPRVLPGSLLAGHEIAIRSATSSALGAWEDESSGRVSSAAKKWKLVFGAKFPD